MSCTLMLAPGESVVTERPAYGFFGKIPAIGDFVHRNLSATTVASVDAWLQEGMYLLGQQGHSFHDRYMVSQVGFFVLPQRVWADHAVAGFIIPSTDRVGRLFPLVCLHAVANHPHIDFGVLSGELKAASDIAVHALQQRLSPDDLYQRLHDATGSVGLVTDVSILDADVFKSFLMGGKRSLWWQQGNTETRSIQVFENMDAPSIFAYLYL